MSVKDSNWLFCGEAQIRTELDSRDISDKTYPITYTIMRLRLSVQKIIWNDVTFFVQLQDSRMWGEEKGTTNSIRNIDLHQGWLEVSNIFGEPLAVQAGRFEVAYSNWRYFGPNNWHYVGRSWDGGRVKFKPSGFNLDGFALTQVFYYPFYPSALPSQYNYPSGNDSSYNVYGYWASITDLTFSDNHKTNMGLHHSLNAFGYYEINRKKSDSVHFDLARYTTGVNYMVKAGSFSGFAEFGYEFGKVVTRKDITKIYNNRDVSAYNIAGWLRYDFQPMWASLNIEIMSGQPSDTNVREFRLWDQPYGTKHQFWGYMNYFSELGKSTMNLGLHDFFVRLVYDDKEFPLYGQLDGHYFTSDQTSKSGKTSFGSELDLLLRYCPYKAFYLELGLSAFSSGDLMKEVWTANPGRQNQAIRGYMSYWAYLMVNVKVE